MYPVIETESLKPVMDELTRQIKPILDEPMTNQEKEAFAIFKGTLCHLSSVIFGYLPPEEQWGILAACGTWLDVGLLMGKDPGKLVDILEKVKPMLSNIELPDWMRAAVTSHES